MGCLSRDKGGTAKDEIGNDDGSPYGICIKSCYKIYYKLNLLAGSITKIRLIKSLAPRLHGI